MFNYLRGRSTCSPFSQSIRLSIIALICWPFARKLGPFCSSRLQSDPAFRCQHYRCPPFAAIAASFEGLQPHVPSAPQLWARFVPPEVRNSLLVLLGVVWVVRQRLQCQMFRIRIHILCISCFLKVGKKQTLKRHYLFNYFHVPSATDQVIKGDDLGSGIPGLFGDSQEEMHCLEETDLCKGPHF